MKTNKSGRGTARSIGWAFPSAYLKKETGKPVANAGRVPSCVGRPTETVACPAHIGDRNYDDPNKAEILRVRRCRVSPGGFDKSRAAVKLRLGSINVGTMVRRSGEVTEMIGRRQLDFCCMQETKWKSGQVKILDGGEGRRYKIFYKGCKEGTSGVGIMIAEKWWDKVVEVKYTNERMMLVRITVGKVIINIVSAYAPHAGRPDLEKEEFYYDMTRLLSGVRGDEKVFIGGDLNGHVGQESDGFEGVHGGNGYGMKNTEGEMVLEFAMFMELVVCNTFFKKDEAKKITYTSGKDENMSKSEIDYILVRKEALSMIQDVTVINGEECVKQHKLLLCKIVLREDLPKQRKAQATDRCKIWNWKKKEISCKFREKFKRVAAQRKVGDVDSTWKEWLVKAIQSMYDDVKTAVKVRDNISEDFVVKVGVHQGSVLSPLLFIIVLDALSMQSRCGLKWEFLYADDLVLIAESEGELLVRLATWKEGLELKRLKVNFAKTKVLKCSVASEVSEESGKFPCGVCGKGVRQNSIKCIK